MSKCLYKPTQSFTFLLLLLTLTAPTPTDVGQIGYFELDCPAGWLEYQKSSGRIILSVGQTTDDRGEARSCQVNEFGGSFQHILTEAEMPSHAHLLSTGGRSGKWSSEASELYSDWGDMPHEGRTIVSSETGQSIPHNNQPPFATFKTCIKNIDGDLDKNIYAQQADFNIYAIREDFITLDKNLDEINKIYLEVAALEEILRTQPNDIPKKSELANYVNLENFGVLIKDFADLENRVDSIKSYLNQMSTESMNIRTLLTNIKSEINVTLYTRLWAQDKLILKEDYDSKRKVNGEKIIIKYEASIFACVSIFLSFINIILTCLLFKKRE